jgi:hypothetical protein
MTSRVDGVLPGWRRPGMAMLVLALHIGLLLALWWTLHRRDIEVTPDRAPLMLMPVRQPVARPLASLPEQRPVTRATRSPKPTPTIRESTWVEPPPESQVASETAPAASSPRPTENLLDTAATRAAIRQAGRQPLLHERAAAATGLPIERTDTALAQQVAEAGTPDCMKDPQAASGQIGPIGLGGLLGLPFLAARVATGNCAQ